MGSACEPKSCHANFCGFYAWDLHIHEENSCYDHRQSRIKRAWFSSLQTAGVCAHTGRHTHTSRERKMQHMVRKKGCLAFISDIKDISLETCECILNAGTGAFPISLVGDRILVLINSTHFHHTLVVIALPKYIHTLWDLISLAMEKRLTPYHFVFLFAMWAILGLYLHWKLYAPAILGYLANMSATNLLSGSCMFPVSANTGF